MHAPLPLSSLPRLFVLLVVLAQASLVTAQQEGYSLEAYQSLQTQANTSLELMRAVDEDSEMRGSLAEAALRDRLALVRYLGDWVHSGELPAEMAQSATETQVVLFQNIVALQVELDRCEEAAVITETMETLGDDVEDRTLIEEAVVNAWAGVARCQRQLEHQAGAPAEDAPEETVVEADTSVSETTELENGDGGEETVGDAALSATPEVVAERRHRVVPYALIGTGAALMGAGVYVGTGPLQETNDDIHGWNLEHAAGSPRDEELDRYEATAARQNTLATGLVGVGGLAVVGGLVWAIMGREPASEVTSVALVPLSDGGMMHLEWRW